VGYVGRHRRSSTNCAGSGSFGYNELLAVHQITAIAPSRNVYQQSIHKRTNRRSRGQRRYRHIYKLQVGGGATCSSPPGLSSKQSNATQECHRRTAPRKSKASGYLGRMRAFFRNPYYDSDKTWLISVSLEQQRPPFLHKHLPKSIQFYPVISTLPSIQLRVARRRQRRPDSTHIMV
jgi:hypothetical protein